MNARISLPELSRMIADSTGFDTKACEIFLRELFATVTETVVAGESVKIKGIGTFKPITVEPRKSVNVNTGEQMIIPGHRKISFTPDKKLAEAVNAPFSMFEPVEISDDITDEMLDAANMSATDLQESLPQEAEAARKQDVSLQISEVTEPSPAQQEATEREEASETETETETETENLDIRLTQTQPGEQTEEAASSPLPACSADEEAAEISSATSATSDSVQADGATTDSRLDKTPYDDTLHYRRRKHFGQGFLIGAVCTIALVGITILAWSIAAPDSMHAISEALSSGGNAGHKQVPTAAKAVAKADDRSLTTTPTPVYTDSTNQIQPAEGEEKADVPTQTSDSSSQTDSDGITSRAGDKNADTKPSEPEVYTDRITKKRYLTTMAREYYGDYNLWPLIYDYNAKLGHPDRIRPGTKILVPSAKTLGINPKDPDVIKRARNRGTEIYRKYKKT